jgi:light-regulated signal transduction histidine kinase (bacteriophytochrome)
MEVSFAGDVNIPDRVSRSGENCANEPIRVPGSIQRHGFLLLLDDQDEHVVGASQNTEEFLQVPLGLILGTSLKTILGREILGALRALTHARDDEGLLTYLGSFPMREHFFSVVTHRVNSERILEFELTDRLVNPEMTNQVFTNFVSKLNSLRSETELCHAITEQIKDLTGFNRVLLYRFDEAGHGTVLCEQNDGTLPSYLDLRFPASDIPQQARALYVLNTVRIIPDASYIPSSLHGLGERSIGALDLSMSILRSVSPVHLEYMRNMGTASSMSVSIICEGKLWGLISGHHREPRMVPYLVRSACDLLTRLVATQLTSLATSASLHQMVHFHAVQRRMLTQMAAENNYLAALADQMTDLIQIAGAEGAALVMDGEIKVSGNTPGDSDLKRLAAWMDSKPDLEVFESRHLGSRIDWASEFSEVASGLLAIRISHVLQSYLMWFRPEVVRTVRWAGEPEKTQDENQRLNPRKSFEIWSELVRGRSKPWTQVEVESATEFRGAIMTISLKRAEEAVQLGEARFLQLTNALPHPVWTADDDGQLTYVNKKWLEQGFGSQGRWYEQERLAAEDQSRSSNLWRAAVAGGTPFELEVRFHPPSNDADRWNLVRAIPYFRADGTRAGWAGTCTDLTDRRQREAALRMTEKLALTGRMTSVVAHEINNPLEAIINLLYLLNDRVKEDETARGYIESAESELQRISGITKQTLRWSKESVQKPHSRTAGYLFKDTLQLFAGKIRNRGVNVLIEGGEEVSIYGALGQISQVMANLIANAIQAVPVGGQIGLSAREDGSMTEIKVRDNGHGMSDEALRHLFEPFYSTKGDLGNGLGLYISHEIVERHGGSLLVKSQVGIGTEIRVRLPGRPLSVPVQAGSKSSAAHL